MDDDETGSGDPVFETSERSLLGRFRMEFMGPSVVRSHQSC